MQLQDVLPHKLIRGNSAALGIQLFSCLTVWGTLKAANKVVIELVFQNNKS